MKQLPPIAKHTTCSRDFTCGWACLQVFTALSAKAIPFLADGLDQPSMIRWACHHGLLLQPCVPGRELETLLSDGFHFVLQYRMTPTGPVPHWYVFQHDFYARIYDPLEPRVLELQDDVPSKYTSDILAILTLTDCRNPQPKES